MRAVLVVALVLGALSAAPASAQTATDPCTSTTEASKDLREATFLYSASSFQVRTTACADLPGPNGDWLITFHLGSDVEVTGAMQDLGRYAAWSAFVVCAGAQCPVGYEGNGMLAPEGTPIETHPYTGRTAFGYGAWADVLPGRPVPDEIQWYAEVRQRDGEHFSTVLDRVPDSGTLTATRNRTPTATTITARPGPAPTWHPYGTVRVDTGTLLTVDGAPVTGRRVQVGRRVYGRNTMTSSEGVWSAAYDARENADVTAYFPGDGVHEPARTAPYRATVRALVTLDLPASTSVRLRQPLELRGVVRPEASGTRADVLVREDRAGSTWRLLRYGTLVDGRYDTYYRYTWSPFVRGRYLLMTRWAAGTSEPGGVLSATSRTVRVTVT